jgi:hypothetical protein
LSSLNDIRNFYNNKSLDVISQIFLCPQFSGSSLDSQKLIHKIRTDLVEAAKSINTRVLRIHSSVREIIETIFRVSSVWTVREDRKQMLIEQGRGADSSSEVRSGGRRDVVHSEIHSNNPVMISPDLGALQQTSTTPMAICVRTNSRTSHLSTSST